VLRWEVLTMPRLMSVAFTEQAVVERRKTVTRRKGWTFLKPGDRLTLCRKVMGRKPGEPLVRVAEVEVVAVSRERLDRLLMRQGLYNNFARLAREWADEEMVREGFPDLDPAEFVRRYFVDAQGIGEKTDVTRIEWRYLDTPTSPTPAPTTRRTA
jgi:hypothetical protein